MADKHHPIRGGVLHFFPGPKRIMWVVGGKVLISGEAWGGEDPTPGKVEKTMKPQKTTAGRYIIHSYGPYSTKTWELAKIKWGTPLKLVDTIDKKQGVVRKVAYWTGSRRHPWRLVDDTVKGAPYYWLHQWFNDGFGPRGPVDSHGRPQEARPDQRYLYDANGDGIPDVWVYNEFGPWAIRYFKDTNKDGALDNGEHLMGEMIHTIPLNESQNKRGLPLTFTPSHGCVHISPIDRDKFKRAGAFRRGTPFIVHRYKEAVPKQLSGAGTS